MSSGTIREGETRMDAIEHQVQQIFAELTRYPLEVLDPAADLEEDLGIDSVKRAEILIAFRERFNLPEDLDVPPERLSSIANIAEVIRSLSSDGLVRRAATVSGPNPDRQKTKMRVADPAPMSRDSRTRRKEDFAAARLPGAEIGRTVIDVLAEVTEYPKDILTTEADLEEDLGIDSAKRADIFAVLGERLGLPALSPDRVRTIGEMVSAVAACLLGGSDHVVGNGTAMESARAGSPARTGLAGVTKPFLGKVALVTGSGHGIGREIATQLAELGASVIVNSFHSRARGEETAEAIRAAGGEAEHIWASVANPNQLRRLFGEIEGRFGCLDFFVSNASNGMIAPLTEITNDHWDRAFRTNVVALHQGALMAAALMRHRGGGKIVSLSSPGAHRYIEYFGCMGPIKAAIESLTRYLAIELAPDNIQVNAISVGPVYGELLSKYPDSERLIPYWESLSAGSRLGEEKDVANFIAYLLSREASKVTGSVLLLDSGGSQRI